MIDNPGDIWVKTTMHLVTIGAEITTLYIAHTLVVYYIVLVAVDANFRFAHYCTVWCHYFPYYSKCVNVWLYERIK